MIDTTVTRPLSNLMKVVSNLNNCLDSLKMDNIRQSDQLADVNDNEKAFSLRFVFVTEHRLDCWRPEYFFHILIMERAELVVLHVPE